MDQIPYVLANGFAKEADIPGINYNTWNFEKAAAVWQQGMILGSETASTVSSRGVYKFPKVEIHGNVRRPSVFGL